LNDIANALTLFGYGLIWNGARVLDGRKSKPLAVLSTPTVWLALCRVPAIAADPDFRLIVVSTMLAAIALLAAAELWRGRDERLLSRSPAVAVLLIYATVLLAHVPVTLLLRNLDGLRLSMLAFGTLLFTVVMAFLPGSIR
jgi:hypothetical protein